MPLRPRRSRRSNVRRGTDEHRLGRNRAAGTTSVMNESKPVHSPTALSIPVGNSMSLHGGCPSRHSGVIDFVVMAPKVPLGTTSSNSGPQPAAPAAATSGLPNSTPASVTERSDMAQMTARGFRPWLRFPLEHPETRTTKLVVGGRILVLGQIESQLVDHLGSMTDPLPPGLRGDVLRDPLSHRSLEEEAQQARFRTTHSLQITNPPNVWVFDASPSSSWLTTDALEELGHRAARSRIALEAAIIPFPRVTMALSDHPASIKALPQSCHSASCPRSVRCIFPGSRLLRPPYRPGDMPNPD